VFHVVDSFDKCEQLCQSEHTMEHRNIFENIMWHFDWIAIFIFCQPYVTHL